MGDLKDKMLIFRSSKTDQEGVGEALYVTSDTRRIIKRYHKRVGKNAGCCSEGYAEAVIPPKKRSFAKQRSDTELAGVEGFISGHSLRVGSAVSLAQAGASVVDMQVAGRWKSADMPTHYAKAELGRS